GGRCEANAPESWHRRCSRCCLRAEWARSGPAPSRAGGREARTWRPRGRPRTGSGQGMKLFEILDDHARRQLPGMVVVIFLSALFSTVGIAAIMPFLSLVANPEVVNESPWLNRAYQASGLESTNAFLFAVGVLTLALLMISNALRALTDWRILSFVRGLQYRISCRLFAQYLSEPYSFYLSRNT